MYFCYWLDKGAIKQLVVVLLLHYQTVFGCYQDPPTLGAFFMKNCGGAFFTTQLGAPNSTAINHEEAPTGHLQNPSTLGGARSWLTTKNEPLHGGTRKLERI